MGRKGLNANLREFVDQYFSDYSSDLFSVFIRRNFSFTAKAGYLGFMSPFVWMFIKSYEELRKFIIEEKAITTLVQLEYGAFEDAVVPICTFVLQNKKANFPGVYIKLSDFKGAAVQPVKVLEAANNPHIGYKYESLTTDFEAIPGSPIAYWASQAVRRAFQQGIPLGDIAKPRQGLATTNNDLFLRLWHEIKQSTFGIGLIDRQSAVQSEKKWFPYNKGGNFRKWFGNGEYVINWSNDGKVLCDYIDSRPNERVGSSGRVINQQYYFSPSITWSFISSSRFGVRYSPPGFIFDVAGSSVFAAEKDLLYLTALLCSSLTFEFLKTLNPTLNFQVGNVSTLPVIWPTDTAIRSRIEILSQDCINLSKEDWDQDETSWDFSKHPMLPQGSKQSSSRYQTVQEQMAAYHTDIESRFQLLKANEEELNQTFLQIYHLEGEYSSVPDDSDITIRRPDLARDTRSFLSYSIGCMMGRYSLDTPGLICAGVGFDPAKSLSFPADEDAIISILDDNWFSDDVTGRFVDFLRVTFGDDSLTANLDFIADTLGRTANETSLERIRKYFVNDFYKDHLKVYQKRPIYWMFTSGKEKAFQALVYMHRYDKSTLSRMRSEYLHTLQSKLTYEIQHLMNAEQSSTTTREKQAAAKRLNELMKKQEELRKYDELLRHMADQQIEIDLDDGVKVNYAKFNGLVAPI